MKATLHLETDRNFTYAILRQPGKEENRILLLKAQHEWFAHLVDLLSVKSDPPLPPLQARSR